jgi:hypothetical protein
MPTTKDTNAANSMAIIIFSIGKKIRLATKTPIKSGIPPPLGIGFLWIIAGCLCFLGSSTILYFLRKIRQTGVAITVAANEMINGRIFKKSEFIKLF